MRKGFHTNAFVWAGVNNLQEIADFASSKGFDFLEVGPGIPLDEKTFETVKKQIPIDAFIYCRNFIDDNTANAQKEKAELFRRMEFASSIGAKRMICSTGISSKLAIPPAGGCNPLASLPPALVFLREAVDKAKSLHLELCLENCPMFRNVATSPYMWRKIFDAIPDQELGLCYDASHFVWQFIDVYKPFEEFAGRIKHLHMKDTRINRVKLDEVGILHNTGTDIGKEENQWWCHTLIGDGEIDWIRFMKAVQKLGKPDLDLSFEMEDHDYELDPVKVRKALSVQMERLQKLEKEIGL